MTPDERLEWLETDGRGGFASGTASGIRTRRYHALLLPATTPPTGRVVLVSGFDAWLDGPWGTVALSSQRYAPDVIHPEGMTRLIDFTHRPWPTWTYRVSDDLLIRHEVLLDRESGATVVRWRIEGAQTTARLRVRPFIAARDYHGMHHENAAFSFEPDHRAGETVVFRPYDGVPSIALGSNAHYRHAPEWYRQFLYSREQERGLDAVEDLASPGELIFSLQAGRPAAMLLGSGADALDHLMQEGALAAALACIEREERRRAGFPGPLERAADDYLVRRGSGMTIVAGYPWFTDWGRDTFIAIRGLCLSTGRLAEAKQILLEWAQTVSEGMLPNRFADRGEAPEYNSVDASLWYVVAVNDLFRSVGNRLGLLTATERRTLVDAILAIVNGYAAGTRFGIRLDADGLLAAGVPGQQLTWMDARVRDREITPRIGKPVEIQALWLNAVAIAARYENSWLEALARGRDAFVSRFWDPRRGYLADVVDVNHVAATVDETFRPNQILAVGGLPEMLVDRAIAERIVSAVAERLWTPLGLRSLEPGSAAYAGRYEGEPAARDAMYHQGTAWPWLIGPLVEASLRVCSQTADAKRTVHERFVQPLLDHLQTAGLGHVSEIADGDSPFTPRGCPFQAWSLGELLRAQSLLAAPTTLRGPKRSRQGGPHGSRAMAAAGPELAAAGIDEPA